MNKSYVFVVCGNKEHIDTLHFSLKSFKRKTQNRIVVITDSIRNEIPIIHDDIIDVETPKEYNHHQASIFLKTSVHRYLPSGGRYVYMDSDILAVGEHCDEIFDEFTAPIRFALDHCNMPLFSPAALNCGCQQEYDQLIQSIHEHIETIDPLSISTDSTIQEKRGLLKKQLMVAFQNKLTLIPKGLKFLMSWPKYSFNDQFQYDRKRQIWMDKEGNDVMTQIKWSKVAHRFGLRFNYFNFNITHPNGQSVWVNQCHHLKEKISSKFNVTISDSHFHHWNGGVFVFGDESKEFLENWHQWTLEIFKDPSWKVRDQGTLIATVWKFGLEKQTPLHVKWNYICDYNNALFSYRISDGALTSDQKKYIIPEFAHVYHHFGDNTWDFWRWISHR